MTRVSNDESHLLQEISKKLDGIITLLKLSNRERLREYSREIREDKVTRRIVETADGTLSSSEFTKAISRNTGASAATVQRRISDLTETGALIKRREGREVYYEASDLFGGA